MSYVTPLIKGDLGGVLRRNPRNALSARQMTSRQTEVLQFLAEGHSMKNAALILNVRPRTIAFHKYQIMEKFQLNSNADLMRFAIQQGVVPLKLSP